MLWAEILELSFFVLFRALGMIGPALDVVGIDLKAFFLLSCSGL